MSEWMSSLRKDLESDRDLNLIPLGAIENGFTTWDELRMRWERILACELFRAQAENYQLKMKLSETERKLYEATNLYSQSSIS